MVDGATSKGKQQLSSGPNKSFNDQNQSKVKSPIECLLNLIDFIQIVLRRLPPSLTSEQFLEIVSPIPDYDYYRFCKADLRYVNGLIEAMSLSSTSLGQQYAFSRAYLNIPNRQDLIVFTEKFQGYVFVDKNGILIDCFVMIDQEFVLGNEYPCSVEYAPNQSRPKSEQIPRKDPKLNSIEQGQIDFILFSLIFISFRSRISNIRCEYERTNQCIGSSSKCGNHAGRNRKETTR